MAGADEGLGTTGLLPDAVADAADVLSPASISISVPVGSTWSLGATGAGLGTNFGLVNAAEPLVHATDFKGVFNLTPEAQVKQLAAPVLAFKTASTRLVLTVFLCAFAHAAMLLRKAAVSRLFFL